MVVENGELSPSFSVANGTKQGRVLAPLLFIIFFSMMFLVAFKDGTTGISIHCRTDGEPRADSWVIRIDPLRFLAGCRTSRLNQV